MSEPGADSAAAVAPKAPRGVLVASTLCWLWGAVVLLSSVALIIPAVTIHSVTSAGVLFALAMFCVSVAYLYAGHALRRQRRAGGWAGALAAALMIALLVPSGLPSTTLVAFLVNVAIVVLVLLNWRHLKRSSGAAA